MDNILLSVLGVHFAQMIGGDYLPEHHQWIFYIQSILLIGTLLALRVNLLYLGRRSLKNKLISLLVFGLSVWTNIDFAVLAYLELNNYDISYPRVISGALCLLCFVPLIAYNYFRSYKIDSDKYSPCGTYMAYKAPSSLQGYIAALDRNY